MTATFQILKGCGYIGNVKPVSHEPDEPPLLPTGTGKYSSTLADDEDEKLRRIQIMADENSILLPTPFNRKL